MKPEGQLIPERALAQHSDVLLSPGPRPEDVLAVLAQATERLARSLRGALAPLLGGEVPHVEIGAARDTASEDFRLGGLAAYSLYAVGPGNDRMLSGIDAEAMLRLVDRAFGGPGEAPIPLPRELPLSAELMVQRIEAIIAARLSEALGPRPEIRPLRRDSQLAQLAPYAPGTRLAVVPIAVTEGTRSPWLIKFALPIAALPTLTGLVGSAPAPTRPVRRQPADPLSRPFADVPMPVAARIVDTNLSLSVASALIPGQILTLPIARSVPLIVAGKTIGHGTVGAVDERVAVQVTHMS